MVALAHLARGGKRRGIYVRQKISKLDLTRTLFFWTTAYIRPGRAAAGSLPHPFFVSRNSTPVSARIYELRGLRIFFDLDNRNAR